MAFHRAHNLLISLLGLISLTSTSLTRAATVSEIHLYEPQIILRLTPKEAQFLADKQGEPITVEVAKLGIFIKGTVHQVQGRSTILLFEDKIDFIRERDRLYLSEAEVTPRYWDSLQGAGQYHLSSDPRVDVRMQYLRGKLKVGDLDAVDYAGSSIAFQPVYDFGHRHSAVYLDFRSTKVDSSDDSFKVGVERQHVEPGFTYSYHQQYMMGLSYVLADIKDHTSSTTTTYTVSRPKLLVGYDFADIGLTATYSPRFNAPATERFANTSEASDYYIAFPASIALEGWWMRADKRTYTIAFDYAFARSDDGIDAEERGGLRLGLQHRLSPISSFDVRLAYNVTAHPKGERLGLSPGVFIYGAYQYRISRHIDTHIGIEVGRGVKDSDSDNLKISQQDLHFYAGLSFVFPKGLNEKGL